MKEMIDDLKTKDIMIFGAGIGSAEIFEHFCLIGYGELEPDIKNYNMLQENISEFPHEKKSIISTFNIGAANVKSEYNFTDKGDLSYIDKNGNNKICVDRLSDLEIPIMGKLYVKMDIEGYELEALKGMEELILKHKPNLVVCVYHKSNDIYEIPEYIKSIAPEYECRLAGGSHLVCYANVRN